MRLNHDRAGHARRRLLAAAAGGTVVVMLAAACSSPPEGVDGDLTDDWGELGEPVAFVPDPGACHQGPYQEVAPLAEYQPVDCGEPHLAETVHVGTFTDEAAQLEAAPAAGSPELREAYRECAQQAEEVLGADFRSGRLWLGVAIPSEAGWAGGARWFRCELLEVESVYGDAVEREGSLAGALSEDSPLALGCFTVNTDGEAVEQMSPVGCDETHEAEFVGVWQAPNGPYLDFANDNAESRVYDGCRERVAAYVDVPVDGDLVFRTGTIADWMSELDWEAGDRSFRCYLYLPDRDLTESLAGAGTDALPVQTE
jgi:hypothetical protein